MERLVIKIGSKNTADAIKEFASHFADATIAIQSEIHDNNFYEKNYGMDKKDFEKKLNIGLAQCILGMTRPWNEVKAELIARIRNG